MASYFFYGMWDWRFLSLILISTILDYYCGIKINITQEEKKRKIFLFLSIFGNLSLLGFFKYFNFFAGTIQLLFTRFGISINPNFLNIILPVGISFYTFQTMSYTIDVYRGIIKPVSSFLDFALFVTFFPQLVAGPIERANNLLPQVLTPRKLDGDKFKEGCYLIFWGLFMKVFIADNLATIVNPVFAGEAPYQGAKVLLALYAFAFQIFCDFAGYSNIARGLGKCFGFDIMVNFNLPYFSTNPSEFWKRWHISLSSWLKDYLYIPLGGNKRGQVLTYRNLFITMLLGGLWHGASWTFIIWGLYQGILLIGHRLLKPLINKITPPGNLILEKVWFCIRVVFFFHLICLGWLIFRAQSITQIFNMLHGLFFNFNLIHGIGLLNISSNLVFILWILVVVQVLQYLKDDLMVIYESNSLFKIVFYYYCFYLIVIYGVSDAKEFIYFQF